MDRLALMMYTSAFTHVMVLVVLNISCTLVVLAWGSSDLLSNASSTKPESS